MDFFEKFLSKINTAEYNNYLKNYYAQKEKPEEFLYLRSNEPKKEKAEKFYKLAKEGATSGNFLVRMKAIRYYQKAAKLGHILAQYEYAQLSIIIGTNQNQLFVIEEIKRYLENAAMAGIEDAKAELKNFSIKVRY